MRVIGVILVLFNVYIWDSSYIRYEKIRQDDWIWSHRRKGETIHKTVREAEEEVPVGGDVNPLASSLNWSLRKVKLKVITPCSNRYALSSCSSFVDLKFEVKGKVVTVSMFLHIFVNLALSSLMKWKLYGRICFEELASLVQA